MHCVQTLSCKAAAPSRGITALVATPLFGCRWQRPRSTEFCGRPSYSSLAPKLPSISPRELYSIIPAVSHVPRATKDDDAIAQPEAPLGAPADPYMPQEWPDFSSKKVDPDIDSFFFHRKGELNMCVKYLSGKPNQPLLLLGPINSGKSVSHAIVV